MHTKISKPAILAANHANSFFDALIIAAYYPEQIYFLARGDAFNKRWAAWILTKINLIPIYRLEEGKQHLGNNEQSFTACMELFKHGGTILIFPEGLSRHELTLRPLRKGAARLAYQAWKESNVPNLVVQPVTLSYNSFEAVPKEVQVHYAPAIEMAQINESQEAVFYNKFNVMLKERLEENPILATNIPGERNQLKSMLLAIPAFVGYVTQRWFYLFWKQLVAKKTMNTVFYDSVLFAAMMLTYPILVLLVTILTVCLTGCNLWWLLIFALPFTAWAYKEYRRSQG